MNIHVQNCSTWLINLHSKQNGGDDCERNVRSLMTSDIQGTPETCHTVFDRFLIAMTYRICYLYQKHGIHCLISINIHYGYTKNA